MVKIALSIRMRTSDCLPAPSADLASSGGGRALRQRWNSAFDAGSSDLRLFAMTFAAGFLFVTVLYLRR